MKKAALVCTLILCLILSACGAKEKTADGEQWDEGWTAIGSALGVESMDGWTVQRNEDVLAAEGIFYASWTKGEAISYTNENGDEVTTYDAQIHLAVKEFEIPGDAELTVGLWKSLAEERYPNMEQSNGEYAGQTFEITAYPLPDDSGPASLGASATGIRGSRAIRVDVVTLESFPEKPLDVLADFLERCHYAQ